MDSGTPLAPSRDTERSKIKLWICSGRVFAQHDVNGLLGESNNNPQSTANSSKELVNVEMFLELWRRVATDSPEACLIIVGPKRFGDVHVALVVSFVVFDLVGVSHCYFCIRDFALGCRQGLQLASTSATL